MLCNVFLMFYSFVEPRFSLSLEDSDISLVKLFNALSEEQRSYRIIIGTISTQPL